MTDPHRITPRSFSPQQSATVTYSNIELHLQQHRKHPSQHPNRRQNTTRKPNKTQNTNKTAPVRPQKTSHHPHQRPNTKTRQSRRQQDNTQKTWRARGDLNPGSPAVFRLERPEACAPACVLVRRLNPYWATGPKEE